ncbi:thiopurine S-methyltransferase [Sessilibacter sp. MAH4]
MDHQFWLNKWQKNEIGFHEGDVNRHLFEFVTALNLAPSDVVFVPLCGKTHDIHWLVEQGFKVIGIDLSEQAINQLFTEMQLSPVIEEIGALKRYHKDNLIAFVGDFFQLSPEIVTESLRTLFSSQDAFIKAIYDRAALVALPTEMRPKYAKHLQTIAARAKQLIITYQYNQSEMAGPPFSVTDDEILLHYADNYETTRLAHEVPPQGLRNLSEVYESVWLLTPKLPAGIVIKDINECPQYIEQISQWHFEEWNHLYPHDTQEDFRNCLLDSSRNHSTNAPKSWCMFHNNELVGTASFLSSDLPCEPSLGPWLGDIYIHPRFRNQGFGLILVKSISEIIKKNGLDFYLFTEDKIGFYEKLGWQIIKESVYQGRKIYIMKLA